MNNYLSWISTERFRQNGIQVEMGFDVFDGYESEAYKVFIRKHVAVHWM